MGSEGELGPDVARPAGTTTCEIFESFRQKPRRLTLRPAPPPCSSGTANMMLDAYRPTFDPHLDIATVVFSHVQCVKTRHSLALVSKLWRDASKPAAAYPLRFDFDAFPDKASWSGSLIIDMMDNDEALSLPYERVVGLLGEAAELRMHLRCLPGSVRLLKWTRENNLDWSTHTCSTQPNGHLPALKYLHENGCPWDSNTCLSAADNGAPARSQYLHENGCPWDRCTCLSAANYKHWDCLQYAVDNKCPGWENYAKEHARAPPMKCQQSIDDPFTLINHKVSKNLSPRGRTPHGQLRVPHLLFLPATATRALLLQIRRRPDRPRRERALLSLRL